MTTLRLLERITDDNDSGQILVKLTKKGDGSDVVANKKGS